MAITKQQEDIINNVDKFARSEIEKYGTPFPSHYEVSNQKGVELAEKLGADIFIVQLGTRLMDVMLGEALAQDKLSEHVRMSAEAARDFLTKIGLEETVIEKVVNCVEGHHRQIPWSCSEAEIVANADCYRFLLVRNWLAYFMLMGTRSSNVEETLLQGEKKLEEKWGILSLDICKQELEPEYRLIKQVIKTAKGV